MLPKSTEEVLPFTCPKIDELRARFLTMLHEPWLDQHKKDDLLEEFEQGVFAECVHARQMLRHHWDETLSHAKWLLAAKDEEIAHLKKEIRDLEDKTKTESEARTKELYASFTRGDYHG